MLATRLSPGNSIVFIADPTWNYEIPLESIGNAPIVATSSCIAIGTLAEMDGETTIRLASSIDNPEGQLAFESELKTPGKTVAVIGSDTDEILHVKVHGFTAHVRVWVNELKEPDLITIEAQ